MQDLGVQGSGCLGFRVFRVGGLFCSSVFRFRVLRVEVVLGFRGVLVCFGFRAFRVRGVSGLGCSELRECFGLGFLGLRVLQV